MRSECILGLLSVYHQAKLEECRVQKKYDSLINNKGGREINPQPPFFICYKNVY